jgi:Tol biopolymer transport system component
MMRFKLFAALVALWGANIFGADESIFLSNTRQLILEGKRSGEGYFSADGKAMVFQSERDPENPFYQIYFLDLETGDSHRVSPGIGKTTCAFLRPGSDDVLFASTHLDPKAKEKQKAELDFRASGQTRRYSWDYDETMDIFAAKRDGTNIRQLTTSPGYDAEGSYSPDGKLIAFCSLRAACTETLSASDRARLTNDPAYFGEIYLMNADGSDQRRLTKNPGYDGGPFFSPDGQRILWRHFEENGAIADIYSMKLDGSDVRRLTDFKCMSWAPYFHPTGEYVIFAANKLGFSNFELYLVDAHGEREPTQITYTEGFDGLPVFSPDGTKLAWTSNRTPQKASQIFIADWNEVTALRAIHNAPIRNQPKNLSPAITEADLRAHVSYLASPELEGRRTGTDGARKAANYLIEQLRAAGVTNIERQPFEYSAGATVLSNQNSFQISYGYGEPALGKDYYPLPFTANGSVEGPVVFAGYGLTVPSGSETPYDSYAGINVSNKIVVVLRYVPEAVDTKRRQELNRYAGLRYKATMARNRGAKAVLVVTGPNSPNAGELAGFSSDGSSSDSGIIALSISGRTADALFAGSGKTLKEIQTGLDTENPHAVESISFTNVSVKITTAVQQTKQTDYNVIAILPGVNTNENVMLGAHYDHLGHGETGGFARKGEENKIHPGADDNASGCAAILELAALFAQKSPRPRSLVFAFWSGEEIGLIGSSKYAEHPLLPLTNTIAYLNFDMIGRLRENKLTINGTGSSSAWKKLLEKRNVAAGFNLQLLDDPYAPTDITALYPKGIPALSFFTGSHDDYHRPTDTPDTLDYKGVERVTKFAAALTEDLLSTPQRPDYQKVQHSDQGATRDALRVYLGTIPNYATEVNGVKLSGVRAGSPADKAGLKGGDIIIQFGPQKIANIYDYTYALDAAKIGQPLTLKIKRDDQTIDLTIIPEARK